MQVLSVKFIDCNLGVRESVHVSLDTNYSNLCICKCVRAENKSDNVCLEQKQFH